jgi:hypothetical protein
MARIAPSSRLEITANLGLPNRALFTQASIALLEVSRRRVGQEYQTRLHGGFEKPLGRFAIRAGGGVGPNEYTRVSAGFSAKIQILQIDYGFMIPLTGVRTPQAPIKSPSSCALEKGR